MSSDGGLTHNAAFKIALRDVLFASKIHPRWILHPRTAELVLALWRQVGTSVDEPLDEQGLEVLPVHQLDGHEVRVIRFPTPTRIAENYFVALALRRTRGWSSMWKRPLPRYLTLEYGWDFCENTSRTVLGEWTREGHLNYGNGPPPEIGEFLAALPQILVGRPPDPAARTVLPQ